MPDIPPSTPPPAAESAPAPPAIPGYELLRRIGLGSYGEVWLARDVTGAYRALKVVYRRTFEHDRPFEREYAGIQKFQPISRLHSSQVSVLEVGRVPEAGLFYYVMELADDEVTGQQINPATYVPKTLRSEVKRRGRLTYAECVEIGLALTTALEHLHKHGLIHRDIKPSNIIFVHGVPKLADIGLVTDVGATISYVGTEGFLPPEGPVSPLADIFSLGKVLYEMATGRDRLDFPELPTLMGNPAEQDRLLELNLVFLKACQNDARKRYQSAQEMHADLALLQSGRSLRQARALERRLAQITRAALGVGALALLAAGTYFWQERQQLAASRREAELAERAKELARLEAEKTLSRLVASHVANGSNALQQGDVTGAVLWFAEAAREDYGTNRAAHEARLASLLARCPRPLAVVAHRGPVHAVAQSTDGRWWATASEDGTVQLWTSAAGEPTRPPLLHSSAVYCVAFSPDARRLAAGCADGAVQVWNPATGEPVAGPLPQGGPVRRLWFHPNGQWLLGVAEGAPPKVWNASGGQLRRTLPHEGQVLDAAFSGDGQTVATAGADATARLWKFDGPAEAALRLAHEGPVTQVAFSPDDRRLLTVSGTTARLWNVATGEPAQWGMAHGAAVTSAAFSPDGRCVATVGQDRTVRLWDTRTGQLCRPPLHLTTAAQAVTFSPDGRYLLVVDPQQVQLWGLAQGEPATPPLNLGHGVQSVVFGPSGDRLVAGASDGSAQVIEWWSGLKVPLSQEPTHHLGGATGSAGATSRSSPVPEQDLLGLAELLAGYRVEATGQRTALSAAARRQGWEKLRAKWPDWFRATDPRLWHEREAAASEQEAHWFGAVFHLDRLLATQTHHAAWRARREAAAQRLAASSAAVPAPGHVTGRIPPRPVEAGPTLLDLSAYYNAALTETWLPSATVKAGNDLAALPPSVQRFNGVAFDARGVIQLSSSALENLGALRPREVTGIPVGRKLRRLHFLHGAAWDAPHGTVIGGYRIHYATGETREVKLVFGVNVREWWSSPQQVPITPEAAVAWQGANEASRAVGLAVRLYQMSWLNRLPEVEVQRLDFYSTLAKPAPFLLAVTAE